MNVLTRTDSIRAAAIDPTVWGYYGAWDTHSEDGDLSRVERQELLTLLHPEQEQIGTCAICSKSLRYIVAFEHAETGAVIIVGKDCGESMQFAFGAGVQRLAHIYANAADGREARKGATKRAAFLELPEAAGLEVVLDKWASEHGILGQMDAKLRKYGSLSEKQIAFALKLGAEMQEAANTPVKPVVPCPTGRIVITGTILGLKWVEGYTYNRFDTCKMIVGDDRGFRVYGTRPSALDDAGRGSRVMFTAALEQSDRDVDFGFFKRPTKAVCLDPQPEPVAEDLTVDVPEEDWTVGGDMI